MSAVRSLVLPAVIAAGGASGIAGAYLIAPVFAGTIPASTGHEAWYASRAAGIAAFLMAWLAMMTGILGSAGALDGLVNRARLMAIHQSASLTCVALGFAHALVIIPDGWTSFGLVDVLVPFASYYRPVELAAGGLSLYLLALISASFWFRRAIGMRTWRLIHLGSIVAFAGALWHGLAAGTDSQEPLLLAVYVATSSTVAGALVLRTVIGGPAPKRPARIKEAHPG